MKRWFGLALAVVVLSGTVFGALTAIERARERAKSSSGGTVLDDLGTGENPSPALLKFIVSRWTKEELLEGGYIVKTYQLSRKKLTPVFSRVDRCWNDGRRPAMQSDGSFIVSFGCRAYGEDIADYYAGEDPYGEIWQAVCLAMPFRKDPSDYGRVPIHFVGGSFNGFYWEGEPDPQACGSPPPSESN